jgi:ATP-dependent 26S proteasome regulatory subunit
MSTTTEQQKEQQSALISSAYSLLQPQQFVDASITTYVMKRLEHILHGKQSFTMKNIAHIFLLLSVDEIKRCVKYILQELGTLMKTHYKQIFLLALGLLKKDHLMAFLRACNPLYLFMRRRKTIDTVERVTMPPMNNKFVSLKDTMYETTMTFQPDITFMVSLVHWMRHHSDLVTYDVSTESTFEVKSRGEMTIQEEWNNIRIYLPDRHLTLQIPQPLYLTFAKQGESYSLMKWSKQGFSGKDALTTPVTTTGNGKVYKTFADFLPDGHIKTFLKNITRGKREFYEITIKHGKEHASKGNHKMAKAFLNDVKMTLKPYYGDIDDSLQQHCNFMNEDFESLLVECLYGDLYIPERYISLIEICFFFYILYHYISTNVFHAAISNYCKKLYMMIGKHVFFPMINFNKRKELEMAVKNSQFIHTKMVKAYQKDSTKKFEKYFSSEMASSAFHSACVTGENPGKFIDKEGLYIKLMEETTRTNPAYEDATYQVKLTEKYEDTSATSVTSLKDNQLQLVITSDYGATLHELHQGLYTLMKECSEVTKQLEDFKVRIWNVSMQQKETIQHVDNPDYIAFMEKKEMIESVLTGSTKEEEGTKKSDPIAESNKQWIQQFLLQEKIPPKQLEKKQYTSIICSEQINEKYKDFRTLYLRQRDMFNLQHSLEMFHKNNAFLEEMGLPNKLGILLYGEPGTGKSSAILSIASYLKKDIYYVNLPTVQTNQELQMVFDHVNKHCVGGGIIVFEDIDAMSKVVHKRTGEEEHSTVTGLLETKDKPLTLEYFLNVLQGSLTQDGTIFIVTTNHLEHLDPAFYRDGRFDVKIEMKKCDHHQLQTIYKHFMKRSIPEDLLAQIPENTITPATFIYHVKHYIWTTLDSCSDQEILQTFFRS